MLVFFSRLLNVYIYAITRDGLAERKIARPKKDNCSSENKVMEKLGRKLLVEEK